MRGFTGSMRLASLFPALYNWAVTAPDVSRMIKRFAGFSAKRSLPTIHGTTLAAWHKQHANKTGLGGARAPRGLSGDTSAENLRGAQVPPPFPNGRVFLFCDEFTNYNDTPMGIGSSRARSAVPSRALRLSTRKP